MANRRIEVFEFRQVIVRMRLGDSDRRIARAGLVARATAKDIRSVAEEHGWLDPIRPMPDDAELAQALSRSGPPRVPSSVEQFREQIVKWTAQGIQGTTIHKALVRSFGYTGHYSSVRRFIQGLVDPAVGATTVLDFEPGQAVQVDFGAGSVITDAMTGEVTKTWFFVMTLCWSRHQYAEIVRDQTVATWLGCHRRAFEFFGGVPATVIIDNPKCAITKACYRDPEVQRSYAAFAEGYGFRIDPCPPAEPKKKGRVEAGVKYIKRAFLPLRDFRSVTDANRQLTDWVLGDAGNRLHGTTHERPLTQFAETERLLLTSLPAVPPEIATWAQAKLHGNCHVVFEKCKYSAPFRLIGQKLWVRATDSTTRIYHDLELVAVHPRLRRAGGRSTVDDHLPPDALAYKMRDPQWCLKQATEVGPDCLVVIERLFAHRVIDNLNSAQGVVSLRKRFGDRRLEAACTRALAFDDPRYKTVKTILERGLDQETVAGDGDTGPLANVYTGGRFLRNTESMLTH